MDKNILTEIKTTKKLLGKSQMTTGNKYQIKITYKNNSCYMIYNDNFYNSSKKEDFIYCLMLDALAYIDSNENYNNFCEMFGYDAGQGMAVFNGCKRQYIKYNKLFNEAEQKQLNIIFASY